MSITPDSIRKLLGSEDLGDRFRAVNQLRQLEPASAFELAQIALEDQNARIRYVAVSQLATLGHQNLDTALSLLRDRLYHDPETDVVAAAADSLGALKLTQAFDDLEKLYYSTSEWLIKMSIIAALGEMGEPRAFTILENALASSNDLIQTIAIGAFGELGNVAAVALLIPYADHADWQIRYRLVQALTHLGGDVARHTLELLTQDESEPVAQEAKNAILSLSS